MDVFGTALCDYLDGNRGPQICISRDDGFVDEHSPGLYFEARPFDFEIPALAHATGSLLDVGSGAGRHLLWCQNQGIAATGVDHSDGAVRCAQQRGCKRVMACDVMHDLTPLAGSTFDTITLFGNNVGIGGDFAGAVTLLRNLHSLARPEGQLLLTGLDVSQTDDPVHLAYHAQNRAAGRRIGEIKMQLSYAGLTGGWTRWYHPLPAEISEIAAQNGWVVETLDTSNGRFFWAQLRKAA